MILYFFIAFFLGVLLTFLVRNISLKLNVLDRPDKDRKFHGRPVPLLGGIAVFASFWLAVSYFVFVKPIFGIELLNQKLLAAFIAGSIILAVGVIDDIHPLSPKLRLLLTSIAAAAAVILGIGLDKITNPLGGILELSLWAGNVLVFIWLLGMMYTTKITDGLDGLTTGVVAIGALMIYFLSSSPKYFQPNVALLSILLFGVCLGFLIFNFYPAKIFLGESGSLTVGFLLGILAVISGGKLATALLAMSIPVFDLLRVIYVRYRQKKPVFSGDRVHLHYQLLNYGLSDRAVVLVYYIISAALGTLALAFQSTQKLFALAIVLIIMLGLGLKWRVLNK